MHKRSGIQGQHKWTWSHPLFHFIKTNNNEKPDKYYVKIKLSRDPTSKKSDLYTLKTTLFDNGEP